jgi:hypothetical protein
MNTMSEKLRELVEIQGRHGNWNYNEYMRGMFNGMELMLSVIEGDREPQYREAPERYLSEITQGKEEEAQAGKREEIQVAQQQLTQTGS